MYYHSCGELCCSGWGATPELQNNNSKIILWRHKNKIIMWSVKSVQKATRHGHNLIWGAEYIIFTLSLHYLGSQQMTVSFSSASPFPPFQLNYDIAAMPSLLNILLVHVRPEADIKLVGIQPKWPIKSDLIPVSVALSNWEYFYSHWMGW